jgi:hypothetical protein
MNEKEKHLLAKMHKAFGSPEVSQTLFESNEDLRKKENVILERMGTVLESFSKPKIIEKESNIKFVEESSKKLPKIDKNDNSEFITEIGRQPEPELPVNNVVNKYVVALSKPNQQDGNIQAVADSIPDIYRKELDIIKKSIADFHRFAQRHSQLGGGGAGDVVNLTFPAITITQSSYTVGRKDYYIGINYPGPVTVNLPSSAAHGRQLVIKDESGLAGTNNITIFGYSLDNDTNANIAINNGSITLIYNNGWRII